jgi:hypothetical protein
MKAISRAELHRGDYLTFPLRLRLKLATHWNGSGHYTGSLNRKASLSDSDHAASIMMARACIRYHLRLTAQGHRDQYPLP